MSEGSVVTSSQPRRRGVPGITGAVILITIGVVFLLSNMGMISVSWFDFLRYWPVLLILFGVDVLLGRSSFIGSLFAAALAVVVIGGLVWLVSVGSPLTSAIGTSSLKINQPLEDAKSLRVDLSLAIAETTIQGTSDKDVAATGSYDANSDLKLTTAYHVSGDQGVLTLKQQGNRNGNVRGNIHSNLDLAISDSIPVDLVVSVGVGQTTLDLSGLNLHSLKLDTGVGTVDVTLPGTGDYTLDVNSGLGSVHIRLSNKIEVQVRVDRGISGFDVPSRVKKISDGLWKSDGFDSAANRISISVNNGIGSIDISD